MIAISVAVILCLTSGFLVARLGLARRGFETSALLLQTCLAPALGLGLYSMVFFVARVFNVMALWRIDVVLFASLSSAWLLFRMPETSAKAASNSEIRGPAPAFLMYAFFIALAAALYSAILRAVGHPYGSGWDSFAIWNLHARFLYRGGAAWRDGFSPLIPWSHPDYPLLLPAAIAHFWTLLGRETTAVPAVIGLIFTFCTVGLLVSAVDIFVGRTSALLAGMALLCTPFFIELGTWQYADVPLSFFFLAAIVLFHLHDQPTPASESVKKHGTLALAGLAVGFAAWTKNEGVLFLCAILLARLFLKPRAQSLPGASDRRTQFIPLLVTLIPLLCVLVYFKRFVAPPGDLFSDPATMLHKFRDASRYWAVLKWYGKEFLRFGHWLLIPIPILMFGFYLLINGKIRQRSTASVRSSALALALTLVGYFFIYLITPYDIYWHLRFSLARLFIQIWPSAIFLFFVRMGLEPVAPHSTSA